MGELFEVVRGRFGDRPPPGVRPPGFTPKVPPEDAPEGGDGGEGVGDAVNGLTIIIGYSDAKGEASTRQVSCIRIENTKGKRYLRAFCHHRRSMRLFLIERIDAVMDAETGEILAVGHSYFAAFADDRVSSTSQGWGLAPRQRSELGAGMTVLAFLSRCDGQVHDAEAEEMDTFAAAWWMRSGIPSEMPERDIADHARRLAPDVEAFRIAAERVKSNSLLAPLVAGYAVRLIEADGRVLPEERYWIEKLIGWLEGDD